MTQDENPIDKYPLDTVFQLGPDLTADQHAFLDLHGFLHFRGVVSADEVEMVRSEVARLSEAWTSEGVKEINGIPLFFGRDAEGDPLLQRMPFTSAHSEGIRDLVRHERFEPIRRLIGDDARVGDEEKDGVVINRYVNVPGAVQARLGWHTDGLRDLFYGRMPVRQLNVGLHLDRIGPEDGGLRLIPGTHTQGFMKMAFSKPYFVWHRPDPQEICIETEPGDLTVHDGRLWHRVARSTIPGAVRHAMYVPYLTGPIEKKGSESPTPGYHHLGQLGRAVRNSMPLWMLR